MSETASPMPDMDRPAPSTAVAIAGVIASMALIAVGNGLMFSFIPVRLDAAGLPPTWAGAILTGLSAGGVVGCLVTGPLVQRTGHARAFMIFSALIVLSNAAIGAVVDPILWIAARSLYGFAICGLFIVGQSWLNDAVSNAIRGRVMAAFYVSYVMGLGLGYYLLRHIDLSGAAVPLIGIAFSALSILPVGMTRLPQPPPPARATVAFVRAWRITPVGIVGMLASGGLSMMVAGFAPIHATAIGYTPTQVSTLLTALPLGTLLFQIPFGWASDRTDRRYVLVVASFLSALAGIAAMGFDGASLVIVVAVYVVWSGTSESLYSLANAHANDRAEKDDLVMLSSTLLFAWSLSGAVFPAIGTVLTAAYGTGSFMVVAVAIGLSFAGFVAWRVMRSEQPSEEEKGAFQPLAAQVPPPVEPTPVDETATAESGMS